MNQGEEERRPQRILWLQHAMDHLRQSPVEFYTALRLHHHSKQGCPLCRTTCAPSFGPIIRFRTPIPFYSLFFSLPPCHPVPPPLPVFPLCQEKRAPSLKKKKKTHITNGEQPEVGPASSQLDMFSRYNNNWSPLDEYPSFSFRKDNRCLLTVAVKSFILGPNTILQTSKWFSFPRVG